MKTQKKEKANFLTAIVSPPFQMKSFIHLDLCVMLKITFRPTFPIM